MLKVGHRGACGYEPENTIRSFRRAIDLGVDMIECDVYRCKSGEAVVMHDPTVNRTTDGTGRVHDLTLSEIRELRINGTEQVPTLQEVIDLCRGKIRINVEIKEEADAEAALEVIKKNDAYGWTMISSNYVSPLTRAHELDSNLTTALIFYSTKTDFRDVLFGIMCRLALPITYFVIMKRVRQSGASWVNLMKQLAIPPLTNRLKKNGLHIGVWTINTPQEITRMTTLGVDALIGNYPDRF